MSKNNTPSFNITYKDPQGNYHRCGVLFPFETSRGEVIYNMVLKTETNPDGPYGAEMRLDEAAAHVLNKVGFLNIAPIKPKRDDGY